MSKGSKRRPTLIPDKEYQDNWDRIFNNGKKSEAETRPWMGNGRKGKETGVGQEGSTGPADKESHQA